MLQRRSRILACALAGLADPAALSEPARAQLQVQVATHDVDEDDPHCFLHGTLSTQTIQVTNPGAAPVLATLDCRVPGDALRVAAKTPPRTIAAGATETMNCSLFDFQDPPVDGSVVSFDIDVNGQVTSHDVTVRCRSTSGPLEACAAARLRATASACQAQLGALASYAKNGDMDAFTDRLGRSADRLARSFDRAAAKYEACPDAGGPVETLAELGTSGQLLLDFVSSGNMGPCGASKIRALGRKCRADLRAWGRLADKGDPLALPPALGKSDGAFERRWAGATRGGACTSSGERDWLRLLVDETTDALAARQALPPAAGDAVLLAPSVTFAAGQRERRLWLPLAAAGTLLFDRAPDLHASVFDRAGMPLGVGGELPSALDPEAAEIALEGPADHLGLLLRRSGDLRDERTVALALALDDPAGFFTGDTPPPDPMLYSPLRTFPAGEDVFELPPGVEAASFSSFVLDHFGFDPELGVSAAEWMLLGEVPFWLCPAGATGGADRPPAGSEHKDNHCAIATFINSMDTKFPGALAADAATNPKPWDEIGDVLTHSNWFGTPACQLVNGINNSLAGVTYTTNPDCSEVNPFVPLVLVDPAPSRTRDGKFYCMTFEIRYQSPQNLAAWAEDCNVKLLAYNYGAFFGHWVDVLSVTPDAANPAKAKLQIQDYQYFYDAGFDSNPGGRPNIDFGVDPGPYAGSAMSDGFSGGNTICGDVWYEEYGFYAVCECDRTDPLAPRPPTKTKSGKDLLP